MNNEFNNVVCSKCGKNNTRNLNFCGNCGNILLFNKTENSENQEQTFSNNSTPKNNVLKKRKVKKVFVIFGIIILVISLIVGLISLLINKSINNFNDPFTSLDNIKLLEKVDHNKIEKTASLLINKLDEDYKNGTLSFDQYIMQLAYSVFERDKLNSKYISYNLDYIAPKYVFEKAFKNSDNLSDESLLYILKKYTLSDVVWDVKDNEVTSGLSNNKSYSKIKPVVSENGDLNKLSNVVLSKNGNFLVYYTTNGKNAITISKANKIASTLENTVSKYKAEFDLSFKYEAKDAISFNKARSLLKKNNIDDKYLNTAMPVFIINTTGETLNGYYQPPINEISQIQLKTENISSGSLLMDTNMITTYAFPYIVVSSTFKDFDDTSIVLSHELFHHYQKYICGNGNYADCVSGNFTDETTAVYASIVTSDINKSVSELNGHINSYIKDVDSSLDKVGFKYYGSNAIGYGASVFAYNYAKVVPNGNKHLFDSMKTTEALKYLYDNSSGKYKEALINTAIKNLTLDYDSKLLIGNENGNVFYPYNYGNISKENNKQTVNINYSSMNYYYINPKDYEETAQLSFDADSTDLTLLLFIRQNDLYNYLYTHTLSNEYVMNLNDFKDCQEIVIAIVNSGISNILSYSYEINNIGNKTPTVNEKTLDFLLEQNIKDINSLECHRIEVEEEFNYVSIEQVKISFNKKDEVNNLYFKISLIPINELHNKSKYNFFKNLNVVFMYWWYFGYSERYNNNDMSIKNESNEYSMIFKTKKNYYEALEKDYGIKEKDKIEIYKSIQSKGFYCNLKK